MSNEVVREQLAKTIKYKQGRLRMQRRIQAEHFDKSTEARSKGDAIELEIRELEEHLQELGGRVEEGNSA